MHAAFLYQGIISGRAGLWAEPVRWILAATSLGYEWVVDRRNRSFDDGRREVVRLSVPVISVGNVTTGGTGKTPLVIELAGRLLARGVKVAVVSRGYGARPGESGDELTLITERLPEARCVADADRVAGGRSAIGQGAEVIILDDGFQHRRIARDLDIVVVDATNPFGFDRVLPRGMLREPLCELGRADLIVVSRAELVEESALASVHRRLADCAPGVERVVCRQRCAGLFTLSGDACAESYGEAMCFAGIGNFEAFVAMVKGLGIEPVSCHRWPDHHHYSQRDLDVLGGAARAARPDVVLTTQKDAVKLRGMNLDGLEPLRVVGLDLEFDDGADALVESRLCSVVGDAPKAEVGGSL